MTERKKKSIFTLVLVICVVILIGYLIKNTFSERHNEEVQFYYVNLDNKAIENDSTTGDKNYYYEVTTKYLGNNTTPVEEERTYRIEVKRDIYGNYGTGSLLKAYFYGDKEKLYLAGLSHKEPLDLDAHSK